MTSRGLGYGYRTLLDARLEAAARLLLSVRDEIRESPIASIRDELARRRLRAAATAARALAAELCDELDARVRRLELARCPHCAWLWAYESTGVCARCGQLRGALKESENR